MRATWRQASGPFCCVRPFSSSSRTASRVVDGSVRSSSIRCSQKDELGLGGRFDVGKNARREAEAAGLLQGAERVPRQGTLAVLIPESCSLGAPPPASGRLGDQLAARDDVVEGIRDHVCR